MTPTARKARTQRRTARHGPPKRPRRGSPPRLAALFTPRLGRASEPVLPLTDPAWSGGSRRLARAGMWALPAYAALHLWLSLRTVIDPVADPSGWAGEVTEPGYARGVLLSGTVVGLLALVGLVALVALLAATRSRWLAAAALLVGLAAATVALPRLGVTAFAAPALGEQVLSGDTAAAAAYVEAQDAAAAPVAAVLVTSSWLLLAVAVWYSRAFSRGDGLLLGVAAPMLGMSAMTRTPADGALAVLVPIGAMLMLAAGIGLAWSGRRLVARPARAESSVCQS